MAASTDFMTRRGSRLVWQGKPLNAVGVNKFDLFLRFLRGGEDKQQAIESIREATRHGLRLMRFAGVGFYPRDMRHWSNESHYWGAFDELVQTAKQHQVFLIPVIHWNLYLFPDMAGECVQDMLENPDFAFSTTFMALYSTVSLTILQGARRIVLELTNEMNLLVDLEFMRPDGWSELNAVDEGAATIRIRRDNFTTEQMIPFIREWAKLVRKIDQNHLISSGFSAPRPAAQHLRLARGKGDWTEDNELQMTTYLRDVHPDPIDILSIHFYRRHDNLRFDNQSEESAVAIQQFAKAAARIGKPLYIGETGDDYTKYSNAPFLKNVLEEARKAEIPLILIWNWMSPGDPYDVSEIATPQVLRMLKG